MARISQSGALAKVVAVLPVARAQQIRAARGVAPPLLNSAATMSSPESSPALQVCPDCGQKTATEFFRTVKKRKVCVLCAERTRKAEAATKADLDDHKLHGGLGWLWKHIAYTAYVSVGGLVIRYLIRSYFAGH